MIAIAGMIMVHFGPNPVPDTTLGEIYEVSHGRASILFVLLAGIGISFLDRSFSRFGPLAGSVQLLIRAAILLPIGLWLQTLDHGVLVILQFYAMYFAFSALIVRLPTSAILALAIGFLALGPFLHEFAEQRWPQWFVGNAPELGDPVGTIVRDLIVSGYYPLITWGAPLCVGIWLGRQNLGSMNVRLVLLLAGAVLVVGSSALAGIANNQLGNTTAIALSNEPHSQTHLWLAGSIGSSILVLALALIVSDFAGRIVWPLAAAGQLALTIYVGHLLLLHEFTDLLRYDLVPDAILSVTLFMAFAVIAATLWRSVFSHGPLEALFRLPSWMMKRG